MSEWEANEPQGDEKDEERRDDGACRVGLMFGAGMATTILNGQSLGKKDIVQAKRVIGTSVGFFTVVAVFD